MDLANEFTILNITLCKFIGRISRYFWDKVSLFVNSMKIDLSKMSNNRRIDNICGWFYYIELSLLKLLLVIGMSLSDIKSISSRGNINSLWLLLKLGLFLL